MRPERILVVDDDASMLRTVVRVLRSHYAVVGAGSGREALEILEEEQPDLAVLDVRMPAMNGFELLARLRERRPDLDVIFMTGLVHELDASLIRSIRERAFFFIQKPFERELLLALVERCLDQRRLARENKAYVEQLEGELAEARAFQEGLLPAMQARTNGFEVAGWWAPCDRLGGDFFDHASVGAQSLGVLMADASGHGVSAAMTTAAVKSAFHDARDEALDPLVVARRILGCVAGFELDRFVTAFCGRLDGARRVLRYVNGGHPAGFLLSADGRLRELEPTGPFFSPVFDAQSFETGSWEVREVELAPGDRLLLFTDGLSEARGPEELFGEARLREAFRTHGAAGPSAEALGAIERAVREFTGGRPQDDDRTMLCVSCP